MSDLERFVAAQDSGGTFELAMAELRAGRKRTHWMWFVFPQIAGLGHSETARRYALASLEEAQEYLRHPVLGPRLRQSLGALLGSPASAEEATAEEIFGPVDALKLRSSMTLFHRALLHRATPADGDDFVSVLDRFFDGQPDPLTLELLAADGGETPRPPGG